MLYTNAVHGFRGKLKENMYHKFVSAEVTQGALTVIYL